MPTPADAPPSKRFRVTPAGRLLPSRHEVRGRHVVIDEAVGPTVLGKELESRGFDSVFLAEHSDIPVSRASGHPGGGDLPRKYYRTLDPFIAPTAMASATTNLLLDEVLAALTETWAKDEAEFHGEFIDFDPIYAWPKPLQRPHPPIFVGGESGAALARLAEQGRTDAPFTIFGAGKDPATLNGYAKAGVERVTFLLETMPEAETLAELDALARLAFDA